eukprot:3246840-Heterocapsa_arctica.AAC.1
MGETDTPAAVSAEDPGLTRGNASSRRAQRGDGGVHAPAAGLPAGPAGLAACSVGMRLARREGAE